jgi:hypothetical protein
MSIETCFKNIAKYGLLFHVFGIQRTSKKLAMANFVKAYLAAHTDATDREIADALTMSRSTANKWRKRLKTADG